MDLQAHLRPAASSPHSSPLRPSVFELLASNHLANLIPPSLHHLLTIATRRHPRYLLPVYNSFDELYALAALVVELHFLRRHNGTFVETFYALRRERRLCLDDLPRTELGAEKLLRARRALGSTEVTRILLFEVGGAYLGRKFHAASEVERDREAVGLQATPPATRRISSWKQWLSYWYKWFLRRGWPVLTALNTALSVVWCLRYLAGQSDVASFWTWMAGVRIRRMSSADYHAVAEAEARLAAMTKTNLGIKSLFDRRMIGRLASGGLQLVLPTSIFLLKFLEWWHASDFASQLSKRADDGVNLSPPKSAPHLPTKQPSDTDVEPETGTADEAALRVKAPVAISSGLPIHTVPPSRHGKTCPICEGEIVTPTACQTGFVYCYTCIHRWLEGQHARQESFMRDGDRAKTWESGLGRCAVTGKRVLGGTACLRRLVI